MAASPLDLRPRGAVAILDAAITVCTRSTGLWSLALTGGALVAAALIHFFDAVQRHAGIGSPAFLLTCAWMTRAVFQGAASFWLEKYLLDSPSLSSLQALRVALSRAPSLFVAAALLPLIDLAGISLSAGIALLFVSAHVVGYAVAVQGRGAPLNLYGTCRRLLGAANRSTLGARIGLLGQVLVFFNLHIAANVTVLVGRKLLGLDLTYLDRYLSLDNGPWLVALIATTFALTEPMRAAVATLLLIDGRVRQEGLDLLAAVEHLPARRRNVLSSRSVARSVVGALLLALPTFAWSTHAAEPAAPHSSAWAARLERVAASCGEDSDDLEPQLDAVKQISSTQAAALSRFVRELERRQEDEDSCESVLARLETGLPLIVQARDVLHAAPPASARAASQRASAILSRPEFINAAPLATTPETIEEPDPSKPQSMWKRALHWIGDQLEAFFKWLRKHLDVPAPAAPMEFGGGQVLANILVVVLVAAVVLGIVLLGLRYPFRGRGNRAPSGASISAEASTDSPSALSRPPEGWAHLADELAMRGQFREAIRSLYLALLAQLHRDGAIEYDPALSNWDYFRRFKGPHTALPPFRELTSRFDFAFYGHLALVEASYREFRSIAAPLLVPDTDAQGA